MGVQLTLPDDQRQIYNTWIHILPYSQWGKEDEEQHRIQEYEEKNIHLIIFYRKIHKQVGRLEALQMADTQSKGLGRNGRRRKSPLDGAVDL